MFLSFFPASYKAKSGRGRPGCFFLSFLPPIKLKVGEEGLGVSFFPASYKAKSGRGRPGCFFLSFLPPIKLKVGEEGLGVSFFLSCLL